MMPSSALLFERLDTHATNRADSTAIRSIHPCAAERELTWEELRDLVAGHAASLSRSHAPASAVLLVARNSPEFIVAFLSTLRAGLRVFPVSPASTAHELSRAAAIVQSKTIVVDADVAAPSELEAVPVDQFREVRSASNEIANAPGDLLLQSSGTTGTPKIVLRLGHSLDAVARNVVQATELSSDDRVLVTIPLCHSYGIENGLLAPIIAGATVLLGHGFDPASVAEGFSAGFTVFPGVPVMFETMADRLEPPSRPSCRLAYSAGAPLSTEIGERFADRFGIGIGQLYGTTEVGSVTFAPPELARQYAGTVGRPMRDVEVRVVDRSGDDLRHETEGEILIKAASMLDRYVGASDAPLEDGYFRTGDLGLFDANGLFYITGRTKLQIDIGGFKVNLLEVEDVIKEHPLVSECVVVPMELRETVQRLKAVVVLTRQCSKSDAASDLRRFVQGRLSGPKVPRLFEFRQSLPKSPTGKTLRREVE